MHFCCCNGLQPQEDSQTLFKIPIEYLDPSLEPVDIIPVKGVRHRSPSMALTPKKINATLDMSIHLNNRFSTSKLY